MAQAKMAGAAVGGAGTLLDTSVKNLLNSLGDYYHEGEDICAYWNTWEDRDQRAKVERTFNNGRFSHAKRTFGIINGRWYCCLTTQGATKKGISLD